MIRHRLHTIAVLTSLAILAEPCAAQAPPVRGDETAEAPPDSIAPENPEAPDDAPTPAAWAKLAPARAPFPRAVERTLAWGRRACRESGGAVAYGPDLVRTGDLTGDGRPDFIVDFRAARCPSDFGLFNGTGGWDIEILVGRPHGASVSVFAGRVGNYDVSDGPGVRWMTFDLHGSFCGLGGADPCVKRRRIDGRRFAFRGR